MSIAAQTDIPAQVLAGLGAAVDQATALSVVELEGLGPDGVLEFAQRFERVRNQLAVLDQTIVAGCEATGLADRQGFGSTAKLLAHTLRISAGEARGRVAAAEQLRENLSATGEPVPSQRPALAAGVAAGQVGTVQLGIALRTVGKVERTPNLNPEAVDAAEAELAEHAARFGPREFGMVADRVLDHIDPDGVEPDDRYQEAHRGLRWWKARDGSFRVEGRLTAAVGAKLAAVLHPLARIQNGPDGEDVRAPDQRHHDALDTALDRVLRSGTLPDTGGIPTTVIVTIGADDLAAGTGHGTFADGTPVATSTLRNLADTAEVVTALQAPNGAILDLGRTQRLANKTITMALYARDKGCSFPGCGVAPQWCERHHIIAWNDGGPTSIGNMTLLCTYHHHHFKRLHWTCRMINHIPWWTPPTYIDPDQKPLRNTRINLYGPARRRSTPSTT